MNVKVSVTQEDIDNGEPRSCIKCPIARALRRTLGKDYLCTVVADRAGVSAHKSYSASLPKEARKFVKNYDHFVAVGPLEFELEFAEKTS